MAKDKPKRLPLPKRFNAAMTEAAYEKLRALNAQYGYGNNYLLTFILENFDTIIDAPAFEKVMSEIIAEYGAPSPGGMSNKNP